MNKEFIFSIIGGIGGVLAMLLGGWDAGLQLLIGLMAIDYVTGIVIAAFNKSNKTEDGGLSSAVGFKGLFRKCLALCFVFIGVHIDKVVGSNFVRDAIVIGFACNEFLSIIENAGILGLPMPKAIEKAIELLKAKEDDCND